MTNPKTHHQPTTPTAPHHQSKHTVSATTQKEANASTSMIEACDRLGQKLDDLANLLRQQIDPGQQTAGTRAAAAQEKEHATSTERGRNMPTRIGAPEIESHQASKSDPASAGALPQNGNSTAIDTSRVADAISRAQNAGQEQAAGIQQALEAIMAHLESQAASANLKVDLAEIMSRLRDLEEQQQSIQTQLSSNRWGPA